MKKIAAFVTAAALVAVTAAGAVSPQRASADEGHALSGKVVESMDSGGYTYALIEKSGKKTWVAVPQTPIKVGDEVAFRPGAEMANFESRSLKRKFDLIIFSAGLEGAPFKGHGSMMQQQEQQPAPAAAAASPEEKITVEKAAGPNGFTVSELISQAAELDKKAVAVRGKVVKVSEKILGKNWVHIKDGSGKIVVTTKDLPKVGDVVTASGTLYKDKDFGSGYVYAVIVEEATIQ